MKKKGSKILFSIPENSVIKNPLVDKNGKRLPAYNKFIKYWNELPHLRKHRHGTKIYKTAVRELNELTILGFSERPWDSHFLETIKIQFLRGPWSDISIFRSMEILSQMCSPGYWPGPDSFLTKMSLCDIIYNPRNQKSFLVYARSLAMAPYTRDREKELFLKKYNLEEVSEVYNLHGIEFSVKFMKSLRESYLKMEQEGLLRNLHGAGILSLAERHASWLCSRNILSLPWWDVKRWEEFKRVAGFVEYEEF